MGIRYEVSVGFHGGCTLRITANRDGHKQTIDLQSVDVPAVMAAIHEAFPDVLRQWTASNLVEESKGDEQV